MTNFKQLPFTVYDWQAQAIAEAVSFVNNHYYKKPAVAFSLDSREFEKPFRELELKIGECAAIVIHYEDDIALAILFAEFGRRSLIIALGAETSSKMQAGLPPQQK